MAYAGSSAAVMAVAIANAIKASGSIVSMRPDDFLQLLEQVDEPLVVSAEGGMFSRNYQYLFGFKGLTFHTKSNEKLPIPMSAQLVRAEKIWIPG